MSHEPSNPFTEELRADLATAASVAAELRARVHELDCSYGEMGGKHCPLNAPCLTCRNEELVAALEAKVPGETRVRDASVEYGFACGRGYLSVNGIVVAMEGDICRDTTVSQWRTGSPFGGSLVWKCEDFKRIEAEFNAPIRAALSKNRGTR